MKENPLEIQISGSHYKNFPIQPIEFIYRNGLGYIEGCVIKYIMRYKKKGGKEDLEKAKHYIESLIELEYGKKNKV
ncbi:MAG: DUF3310 domain-containing protein [Candidatus Izemoplasmatales bacterium]|nr:DUF3310 domain-containing protein [Candidatus Izemoplasmatales bacterium]